MTQLATNSQSRTIAIGDIHGCSAALEAVLQAIDPSPSDTIVPLGDFVDRGIDSKGVLDRLIKLATQCQLIPILGNHDQMMLLARDNKAEFRFWLNCGGDTALDSYGSSGKLSFRTSSPASTRLLEWPMRLWLLLPPSRTPPRWRRRWAVPADPVAVASARRIPCR